ncbi:MAG: hypothetical protein ACKVU1_06555 [bacterium]
MSGALSAHTQRAKSWRALAAISLLLAGVAAASGGCASRGAERDPSADSPRDGTGADSAAITDATIQDVLASPTLVGRAVRVTGHCSGYPADVIPGSPPLTRSDWILEGGGFAIYVSGDYPPGCSPTARSEKPVTITARVVADSVEALGGARTLRRYLVRLDG